MEYLPDVDWREPRLDLLAALAEVERLHRVLTNLPLVITSGRRPYKGGYSGHSPRGDEPFWAADFRRWYLDALALSQVFARILRWHFPGNVHVVLEPEELGSQRIADRGGLAAIEPHFHIQVERCPG